MLADRVIPSRKSLGADLGNALYDARIASDESQVAVAKRLGISRASVSNMEHGRQIPSLPLLVGMCRLYAISLDGALGLAQE